MNILSMKKFACTVTETLLTDVEKHLPPATEPQFIPPLKPDVIVPQYDVTSTDPHTQHCGMFHPCHLRIGKGRLFKVLFVLTMKLSTYLFTDQGSCWVWEQLSSSECMCFCTGIQFCRGCFWFHGSGGICCTYTNMRQLDETYPDSITMLTW